MVAGCLLVAAAVAALVAPWVSETATTTDALVANAFVLMVSSVVVMFANSMRDL